MNNSDMIIAGKIWNEFLGFKEKSQILQEIMKEIPLIDYILGPGTPWNKFRLRTRSAIVRFLDTKGELLFYKHQQFLAI